MNQLRPAIAVLLALSVITGVVYPLVVWAATAASFPAAAAGSPVRQDGRLVGSELLGQHFTDPAFFWGRPSASPGPARGEVSGASNLGPLNPDLQKAIAERAAALRSADPGNTSPIPIDLVTASASGLDPHISPAAAFYQAPRVARLRGLPEPRVRELVDRHIEPPQLGFIGAPRVNVLRLNLELATLKP